MAFAIHRLIAATLFTVAACSSSDDPGDNPGGQTGGTPGASGGATGTGGSTGAGGATGSTGGIAGAPGSGGVVGSGGIPGAGGGPVGGASSGGFPPTAGGASGTGGAATGGATGSGGSTQPPGPDNGDPGKPIIAVPNLACAGKATPVLAGTNINIGGRDVFVSYPCEKHEGAPATFILNLHGTMPTENLKMYGTGYFPAHVFAGSHNLIVAAPKAVGSQWGRSDNGADEPHLMAVIDWVYQNLKGFDIRGMWVAGHSWGGFYAGTFGCKPELQSKVKGVMLMSGGSAACSSRISVLISTAEGDGRQPADQSSVATGHGCDAAKKETILNNDITSWPNCDPGFAHANYYMRGKQHETFMDREVVQNIVDWIKLSRQ